MRVLFLGAGNVGSNAALQLAQRRPDVHIRVGDLRLENAQRVAADAGSAAEAVQVDVHDRESLAAALADVDIVLNTAGPFYRNAVPIMEGAIAAKAHYIDVNDDDDVAVKVLADDGLRTRAAEAGVRMIIGCGTTPGVSNIIARHSMDQMDVASRVIVTMLLSFQTVRYYSPAVLDHMFHISTGEVTKYEDGGFKRVPGFGDEREIRGLPPYGTHKSYKRRSWRDRDAGPFVPQAGRSLRAAGVGRGRRERALAGPHRSRAGLERRPGVRGSLPGGLPRSPRRLRA